MRSKLLISAAALLAGMAMASAQTMPQGGAGQPSPGAAPERSAPSPRAGQPDTDKGKAQQGAQGQGQDKGKAQQGAQGQDKGKAEQGAQGREREPTGQGAQGQRGQDSQPPRTTEGQAGQGGGSATLTAEQRTRVRETVITRGPRVTSVDFAVRVGTVVPRTVTLVVVPAVLVEFYPQYRGRKYFVYNDEIIIVDDEYRIVAVIQV